MYKILIGLIAVMGGSVLPVMAGEPPVKFEPGIKTKINLLFPSVSEIYTAAEARGLVIDERTLQISITVPEWQKLSDRQKRLQLGSLLGDLVVSAIGKDTTSVSHSLEGILAGLTAIGIPENSNSQVAIRNVLEKIKVGAISRVKLLSILDDLRREELRDISAVMDDASVATILAGAWLKGGILLAGQVKTDESANKLAEFVARPELIDFVEVLSRETEGENDPARKEIIDIINGVVKKQVVTKKDLDIFAIQAEKLLG